MGQGKILWIMTEKIKNISGFLISIKTITEEFNFVFLIKPCLMSHKMLSDHWFS